MRRTAILLLLFAATPLLAADGRWHTSVLGVLHGGTVTLAWAPRAAWDVEAALSAQRFDQVAATFQSTGLPPVTTFEHRTLNPVDLFVTRHFATEGRITPFVHAGVRYVDVPDRVETVFVD